MSPCQSHSWWHQAVGGEGLRLLPDTQGLLTVSSLLLAVLLPSASESHRGSSQLILTSSSHRESLLSTAGLPVGVGRKAENACKHICVPGLLEAGGWPLGGGGQG